MHRGKSYSLIRCGIFIVMVNKPTQKQWHSSFLPAVLIACGASFWRRNLITALLIVRFIVEWKPKSPRAELLFCFLQRSRGTERISDRQKIWQGTSFTENRSLFSLCSQGTDESGWILTRFSVALPTAHAQSAPWAYPKRRLPAK